MKHTLLLTIAVLLSSLVWAEENVATAEFPPYTDDYPGTFEDYQRAYADHLAKQKEQQDQQSITGAASTTDSNTASTTTNTQTTNTEGSTTDNANNEQSSTDSTTTTQNSTTLNQSTLANQLNDQTVNSERTDSTTTVEGSTTRPTNEQPSPQNIANANRNSALRESITTTNAQRKINIARRQEIQTRLRELPAVSNDQLTRKQYIVTQALPERQDRITKRDVHRFGSPEINYTVTTTYVLDQEQTTVDQEDPLVTHQVKAKKLKERLKLVSSRGVSSGQVSTPLDPETASDVDDAQLTAAVERAFEKLRIEKDVAVLAADSDSQQREEDGPLSVVTVSINPEETLYDVEIYEDIPKSVANSVEDLILEGDNVRVVDPDPLLVWHFAEISAPVELSYAIKGEVDPENLEETATVPVALDQIGEVEDNTEEVVEDSAQESQTQEESEQAEQPAPPSAEQPAPESVDEQAPAEASSVQQESSMPVPLEWIIVIAAVTFGLVSLFVLRRKNEGDTDFDPPLPLVHYIANQLERGASEKAIARRLVQEGWKQHQVKAAFTHHHSQRTHKK